MSGHSPSLIPGAPHLTFRRLPGSLLFSGNCLLLIHAVSGNGIRSLGTFSVLEVCELPGCDKSPSSLQKGIFQSGANSYGRVELTEKQTPAMENKEDCEKHGLLRVPQRQGFKEEAFPAWLNDSERQRV